MYRDSKRDREVFMGPTKVLDVVISTTSNVDVLAIYASTVTFYSLLISNLDAIPQSRRQASNLFVQTC